MDIEAQVFARRMSRHLAMLADQADELARKKSVDCYFGERESKIAELAGSMRALARIMINESIACDEPTKAQG